MQVKTQCSCAFPTLCLYSCLAVTQTAGLSRINWMLDLSAQRSSPVAFRRLIFAHCLPHLNAPLIQLQMPLLGMNCKPRCTPACTCQ